MKKNSLNLSPKQLALLKALKQKSGLQTNDLLPITRRKDNQDIPVSFAQEWMWLLEQIASPAYNNSLTFKLSGKLEQTILEKSLNEIIKRHEILRTTFLFKKNLVQVVNSVSAFQLPMVDFSNIAEADKQEYALELLRQKTHQPFNLSQDLPFRIVLLKLSETEHWLHWALHHIVTDDASFSIILKELASLYESFLENTSSPLPVLPFQYGDYAYWQQSQIENFEQQLTYWRKQLENLPPALNLPTDRQLSKIKSFPGRQHTFSLSPQLTKSLKSFSQKARVTLFSTLLTVFYVLLYRYTQQHDLIVGVPVSLRHRPEMQDLIGVFINTVLIRCQPRDEIYFQSLLQQVHRCVVDAREHQKLPYHKLIEFLRQDNNLDSSSLIQVVFDFQRTELPQIQLSNLTISPIEIDRHITTTDLTLHITNSSDSLTGYFKYSTDLFDISTIERMVGHFQTLLEGIVENPQLPISQLPLLSKTQQLNCVLIGQENFLIPCAEKLLQRGHVINGIVATGQMINDWAKEREIPCTSFKKNLVDFLSKISFDYLFSIYNLNILPAEILNLPSLGAINLHDALLPKYGGLYAPCWAIFNRETVHGLTWHWMTEGIDEGDILKQIKLPISESETAFTLNVKCYDAALESFAQLIDTLSFDQIEAQPQNLEQSLYFNAVQRPTPGCIVNWNWTAQTIDAFIRSLNFGSYSNPFGLPKLYAKGRFYLIIQLEISSDFSEKLSGTIVKLERDYLQISTASQDVILRSLQTLEGQNLSLKDWVAELNLQVGDCLESLSVEDFEQIEEIEANCLRREAFWVKQLSKMELIELPIREKSQTFLSDSPKIQKQLWEAPEFIQESLSQTSINCSPQDFLLTAFVTYFARISQSTSFSIGIGSSIASLQKSKLNQVFASVVPTHLKIELDETFENNFALIKKQINRTQKSKTFHRDIVTRYPELNNLKNLSIEQHIPVTVQLTETLADYHPSSTNKFVLVIARNGDCACFYDQNCYSDIAIEKLLQSLTTFVKQLTFNSNHKLANLCLIPSQDWINLQQWNNSDIPYQKNLLVNQLFEAQVELTPKAIALQDIQHEQTLTYNQLNQRANQLAHHLQYLGVEADVLVGICTERSVEMVISILAVLKAGGAYLPIDPNYPTERIALIMSDAQISLLLTQESLINNLPEQATEIFCLDRDWHIVINQDNQNPVSHTTPEHLAYVIYTSGSTGNPKGVMIQHDSLVNFTQASVDNYRLVDCDRVLQFASISFDAAAEEIYPCLISGGTLVLRTDEMLSSVTNFLKNCQDWQLTVLDLPTAYWQQIAIEIEAGTITLPESLRLVIIGGERVSPEYVKIWQFHVGDYPQLINTYGPTEGTVVATLYPITANSNIEHEIPIGKAIANLQTYVLDRNLQPLPIGVRGELHIGGMGIARGYLNRPQLTKEKFIQNPFSNSKSERLYKTGDLARYLPDGNIEFLGRIDNQVKIRGFRIETVEIESVLNTHPQVNQAVVIAREDIPGDKRLVAYIVTKNESLTTKKLREFLKQKLPEYMVPSAFVALDKLPLTPNDKVDRKALPVPDISSIQLENNFVPPSNPTEEILVNIWADVLSLKKVGIHNNFFELGGHSLLGTQVISRVRQAFSVEISLKSLFEKPTISGLSEHIKTLLWLNESQGITTDTTTKEMEEIEL